MCTRCAFVRGLAGFAAASGVASTASDVRAAPARRAGDPEALEIALPRMRRVADTVWLGELTPNVWVHTTTQRIDASGRDPGYYYPANGALVIDGDATLLIDTGWNDAQTSTIVRAWERLRKPPIARAIVTHFHKDRLGGLRELERRGIPAFGNPLTIGLALDNGSYAPRALHDVERRPQRLGRVEVSYPGAGHTTDNVVAWVPQDRVLFGGCLVKATTAPDLGYLADGNVAAYPATVRAVVRRYAPRHVIAGHGTVVGDALAHTIAMADAAARATGR